MARNRLGRRAFLVGAGGVCVALPMLEATHGEAWAAGEPLKAKRFIVVFSHGGIITCRDRGGKKYDGKGNHHGQDLWAPADPGPNLVVGEEMAPLTDLASDLILLRGVDNLAGTLAPYGGGHRHSNVTAMTCADAEKSGEDNWTPLGPSLDQVLAQRLNADNPVAFPSIDLNIKGHQYGTPFFSAAKQAVSSESSPTEAFNRLFKDVNPSAGPDPALLALRARKKSVLDGVLGGFDLFRSKVGKSDQMILDAHAEHIRGMEQQLAALGHVTAECTLPDVSGAPSSGYPQDVIGPLLVDIMIHAMRCGLTNVGTLQISDFVMPWLPTPWGHSLGHSLGHAARDVGPTGPSASRYDDFFGEIVPNRQWRMEMLARLLKGLRDTPEGTGNMLDNSVVLFTSEFGTASIHSVRDVPCLLAGKAGGLWQTGRHINYNKAAESDPASLAWDTDVSTHNVFTSILHAFGYTDPHFGNTSAKKQGPLSELG